jgi:hypothetical protein
MLEETQQETTTSKGSYGHYIAYSILILALIASVYFNVMPQKKSVQNVQNEAASISFMDLPLNQRTQYVLADEFDDLQNRFDRVLEEKESLVDEISTLQEELNALKQTSSLEEKSKKQTTNQEATQATQKAPQQEMQTTQTAQSTYMQNSHDIPKVSTLIMGFTACYDMNVGQYNITNTCRKTIIDFIEQYKEAAYFEIIGIVDETEFTLYKNLEINDFIYDKLGITQQSINVMKKLSQSGLAKHRAIEANWVIKANGKKNIKAYNANYHLLSNKEQRGIVIRAYQ